MARLWPESRSYASVTGRRNIRTSVKPIFSIETLKTSKIKPRWHDESLLTRVKCRECARRRFIIMEVATLFKVKPIELYNTFMKRLRAHPWVFTRASQLASCKRGFNDCSALLTSEFRTVYLLTDTWVVLAAGDCCFSRPAGFTGLLEAHFTW
jgi:hypothetical protein